MIFIYIYLEHRELRICASLHNHAQRSSSVIRTINVFGPDGTSTLHSSDNICMSAAPERLQKSCGESSQTNGDLSKWEGGGGAGAINIAFRMEWLVRLHLHIQHVVDAFIYSSLSNEG